MTSKLPVMTKLDFQKHETPREFSELFFYSGGSSGDPQMSIFTYEDYHRQMELASEGLYAAGLNPVQDVAINLFFAGGLYGGFISFFTILEKLQCPQFPMGAHPDHRFVAETIVKNKISVLLGMPSYILQLFQSNEELFEKNPVVQKIYYGGEHLTEAQKLYIQTRFHVPLVKSASYGSVDAGPLGFQCLFSEGGVHHLHNRLHDLEIIDLEKDEPVTDGATGRLLFTSKVRRGQKIQRYEIGDVGRWLSEPCPCGRTQPRFELMGRTGDIFRIGATFLNYQKFQKILSNSFHFSGAFQIHLHPGQGLSKEKIVFYIEKQDFNLHELEIKFLEIREFFEATKLDHTLDFEIQLVPLQNFTRSSGSGKVRSVVDHRR